ncbi:unnamed protein product [Acanthoscelides obtectus]|uniref:Uncharacterized protein n=1 Tax=Acanthoscelides obtectus TaxID=200917 RepID=A0A9P0JTS0_ACAOB|nr:unnamed protein product [Acanthoscelides obtectus]CAK1667249.1 hypothetical protein AOBTE_LOCUS25736 [Acanthoscelides obtectus]
MEVSIEIQLQYKDKSFKTQVLLERYIQLVEDDATLSQFVEELYHENFPNMGLLEAKTKFIWDKNSIKFMLRMRLISHHHQSWISQLAEWMNWKKIYVEYYLPE